MLELLSELGARFGLRIHAYVLMDNHSGNTPKAPCGRAPSSGPGTVSLPVWCWGTEAFAQRLRRHVRANAREQVQFKGLCQPVAWEKIVSAVEVTKGQSWEEFSRRHGDWGRDAALYLGRRTGRLSLAQLGQLAGGLDYAAVGQAVSRFGKRLEREPGLRQQVTKLTLQLSNVEM